MTTFKEKNFRDIFLELKGQDGGTTLGANFRD